MANIKPFKGYLYNPDKVNDIATVLAPTRYNISDEQRNALYDMNKYNAVRLFDGRGFETDDKDSNKYTRAAEYLKTWIDDGILVRDEEDTIYLYQETVEIRGSRYQNITFVALVEIEELGKSIRMCEEIREISMQDRYELLKTTNTDLSMISCLYIDHSKQLISLMNKISRNAPDMEFASSQYDMNQRVWRITDKDIINTITSCIKNLNLYITDGQTRYTTCLKYRDYMREKNPNHTGNEPYNYTMVSLFDSNSDGVAIMAEHRKIKLPGGFSEDYFVAAVQEHFKVEKIIVDAQDDNIASTMKKQIQTKRLTTCFAVYHGGNYFYRLTLTDTDYIKKKLMPDMSDYYCGLDTVVLRKLIINDIFGIEEDYEDLVSTSISTTECQNAIDDGTADVMVVLNPVKFEEIEAVTGDGEKLPFRSISIFPKPSVGAVINVKED